MHMRRREFVFCATSAAVGVSHSFTCAADPIGPQLIIDTHQHLWERDRLDPPWVGKAAGILRPSYGVAEYREATRGLNVRSLYIEVDAAEGQLDQEAETAIAWCAEPKTIMVGAIIGGRPAADDFTAYLDRHAKSRSVQGVRRILHSGATPAKTCLDPKFIAGVRELGKRGLTFDLCMRPGELSDAVQLATACPETKFVLDHCGNADPKVFLKRGAESQPAHSPDEWKRSIEALARCTNVVCKISGVVARAPLAWEAGDLAPVVTFCLDAFGPDRVIFGSDWPVCLLRATLQQWVAALRLIIAERPPGEQDKLWSGNALRMYKLNVT
jgi:L-fuconolactonase